MASQTVVSIEEYKGMHRATSAAPATSTYDRNYTVSLSSVIALASSTNVLRAEDLYNDLEADDGAVSTAIRLIGECISYLDLARQIDPDQDYIEFDERMMRARKYLRDLFALREIGDGFASVTSALLWGLHNREFADLSARNISTIIDVLRQLRSKPLMHFDTSMKLLDELEAMELNIEPPSMEFMLET